MTQKSAAERIRELLEERFQKKLFVNMLAPNPALFDLSRPNIHDNKTEFLLERDTVAQVIAHLQGVFDLLAKDEEERSLEHEQMIERLRGAIESSVGQAPSRNPNQSASALAIKNVMETGFYFNSLIIVLHMLRAYKQRLSELNEQEQEFWSVSNRPPNYYARTIALRFAKFYARETGSKPTFGTSRDGPYPSTDYGRLLEEIFDILKMDGDYKRAGQWAVTQITDDDFAPPSTGLIGELMGLGGVSPSAEPAKDPKTVIAELLEKGRAK